MLDTNAAPPRLPASEGCHRSFQQQPEGTGWPEATLRNIKTGLVHTDYATSVAEQPVVRLLRL